MKTKFFTLGSFDTYTLADGTILNQDTIIQLIHPTSPRAMMFALFGDMWSMEYGTEIFQSLGHFSGGIVDVGFYRIMPKELIEFVEDASGKLFAVNCPEIIDLPLYNLTDIATKFFVDERVTGRAYELKVYELKRDHIIALQVAPIPLNGDAPEFKYAPIQFLF